MRLGQRVAKTVEGVTTLFVYDQDGRLILETEAGAEGAGREYLHRGDNRLAMYDMAGDAWYFFQNDPIGTPVAVTDADNRIVWEAVYLPCGEAAVNPASLIEFNLRFAGQYYDKETGLHYNYHRYYDPRTGRYITPDPIGLAGGINLYAYVSNNPVMFIDPYGLELSDIFPGIQTAIVQGLQGGANAVGQTANAAFDIAINGHPLAQTALGVAFVSEAAPFAAAAYISASSYLITAAGTEAGQMTLDFANKALWDIYGTGQPGFFYIGEKIWNFLNNLFAQSAPCE